MVEGSNKLTELVLESPALKRRLTYPRFQSGSLVILIIDSRYHLIEDLKRTFSQLGHQVHSVPMLNDSEVMVKNVLRGLSEYQPDFLMTINHFGFDEAGTLGTILETLEIPIAVWYVDSPLFVLKASKVPAPKVSQIFSWEKAYLDILQKSCIAEYLPLATDPHTFSASPSVSATDLSFVGSSGSQVQAKWNDLISVDDEDIVSQMAKSIRDGQLSPVNYPPISHTHSSSKSGEKSQTTELQQTVDQLAAATWRANSALRSQFVRCFSDMELKLYGDEGWAQMVPEIPVISHPSYGPDLAKIYRDSAVNLNITSLQMPTALNQRVFDVPAAGGFILTDTQDEVLELFQEDEIVTWSTFDEAIDKTKFYLRHEHRRIELIERCQRRVLADHTYSSRVAKIVKVMRQRFGTSSQSKVLVS